MSDEHITPKELRESANTLATNPCYFPLIVEDLESAADTIQGMKKEIKYLKAWLEGQGYEP